MKTLLNLTKVRNVMVWGLNDDYSYSNRVKIKVNYYNGEPALEHEKKLTNLCEGSKDYDKKLVEKAYDDIKQALLKGEKYVEIEL
jgi:hypothetical protein